MKYEIGELVAHGAQFVKILGRDVNGGVTVYWCRAVPGTRYLTLREEDLRELQ